jgi:O-methyltransferase
MHRGTKAGWIGIIRPLLHRVSRALDNVVAFRDSFYDVHVYNGDSMRVMGRDFAFLRDPVFQRAYQRGVNSGHGLGPVHIELRAYFECWAAQQCLQIPGNFVCCGVNTGFIPLAICEYVNINNTDKYFYLFDTYKGIPESQMSEFERPKAVRDNKALYFDCYDTAVSNFSKFKNAKIVRGEVPGTLAEAGITKVSYLSIDMNIAYPERKAIEHFWPMLSPGGMVVLDDYAFIGHSEQKQSMDEWASMAGVSILTLPTGQGFILKSPY